MQAEVFNPPGTPPQRFVQVQATAYATGSGSAAVTAQVKVPSMEPAQTPAQTPAVTHPQSSPDLSSLDPAMREYVLSLQRQSMERQEGSDAAHKDEEVEGKDG